MIRLERRSELSRAMTYLSPVLALVLTLLAGIALFSAMGVSPSAALYTFFVEPVTTVYGLTELGVKATPLILIGVALSIGFRCNVWNIGAEGQLTLGAIFGSAVALYFYEVEGFWLLPLMLVAGIIGGMAWAAIPALLRTRFNSSEILTSLMLTYVATLLLSYLVHGPFRDPDGYNFPESRIFHDSAILPIIFDGSRLHLGFALALLVVVAGWILISRSLIGFQLRVMAEPYVRRRSSRVSWGHRGLGPYWSIIAANIPRIWLYRDHCCLCRQTSPGWCSICRLVNGSILSWRRKCTN